MATEYLAAKSAPEAAAARMGSFEEMIGRQRPVLEPVADPKDIRNFVLLPGEGGSVQEVPRVALVYAAERERWMADVVQACKN